MISLLDARLSDVIASVLFHSLWQTTAIILLASLCLKLIPSRASQARYAFSLSTLLVAVAAPITTVALLSEGSPELRSVSLSEVVHEHADDSETLFSSSEPIDLAVASESNEAPTDPATLRAPLAPIFADLWAIGVVVLLLRLFGALVRIEGLSRRGHRPLPPFHTELVEDVRRRLRTVMPVDAVLSARVHVPTVIGWARPRILIPASALFGLTPSQFEAVLAHEMAHIRRWDYLVNLLQSLIETLFFFHPAVWWLSDRVRIEREHCCDDIAVRLCGRTCTMHAFANLEALRHEPRPSSPTQGPALAADGGRLLERIQRMATPEANPSRTPPSLSLVVSFLVLFALLGAGWSVQAAPTSVDPIVELQKALERDPTTSEPKSDDPLRDPEVLAPTDDDATDPEVGKVSENLDPLNSDSLPEVSHSAPAAPELLTVLATKENLIVLNHGERKGVNVGDEFAVVRKDQFIAKIAVAKVQADLSSAQVTYQVEPIRPGDRAMRMSSSELALTAANRELSTKPPEPTLRRILNHFVILEAREDAGLVVLNGGVDDGVQVGDELQVWRESRWIGTVEVVRTAEDMSGARIQRVESPIRVGDRVGAIRETLEPIRDAVKPRATVTVDAIDPQARFVILKGTSAKFAVGQRWWIERGKLSTGYVEIIDSQDATATARVRLVSPDRSIEPGDQARFDRAAPQ